MSHFVFWIPERRSRDAPAWADKRSIAVRAFAPRAHVTRQMGLARRIGAGDVVWLVRATSSLGHSEAALDGRIVVAGARREQDVSGPKLVFMAGEGSAWLPWRDAGPLLRECRFLSRAGAERLREGRRLGQQLRITRELDPDSVAGVESLARAIQQSRSVFVSYRWRASGKLVPLVLPLLAQEGLVVWWDLWSGPRRLQEERALDRDLARMLSRAIHRSDAALVVRGDGYDQASWTSYEFREIVRSGVPRLEISHSALQAALSDGRAMTLASWIKWLIDRAR